MTPCLTSRAVSVNCCCNTAVPWIAEVTTPGKKFVVHPGTWSTSAPGAYDHGTPELASWMIGPLLAHCTTAGHGYTRAKLSRGCTGRNELNTPPPARVFWICICPMGCVDWSVTSRVHDSRFPLLLTVKG